MAENIYVRKTFTKEGVLPNRTGEKKFIKNIHSNSRENEEICVPWELRAFNQVDVLLKKATPVFFMLTVAYLAAHIVWAVTR